MGDDVGDALSHHDRLRVWAQRRDPDGVVPTVHRYDARCPCCTEGHETVGALLHLVDQQADEIERLQAALAPFAAIGERMPPSTFGGRVLWSEMSVVVITVTDVRRAAAVGEGNGDGR